MKLKSAVGTLRDHTFVCAFLALLFLILPGTSVLAAHFPELLGSLDWVKLIMLSASITAPVAFLNMMIAVSADKELEARDDVLFISLILGTYAAAMAVYLALLIFFITGYTGFPDLGFEHAREVITVLMAEGLVALAIVSEGRSRAKASANKS